MRTNESQTSVVFRLFFNQRNDPLVRRAELHMQAPGTSSVRCRDDMPLSLSSALLPAPVRKNELQRGRQVGRQAFRAPNQGLESSLCNRIAGWRLAESELFTHRHRSRV